MGDDRATRRRSQDQHAFQGDSCALNGELFFHGSPPLPGIITQQAGKQGVRKKSGPKAAVKRWQNPVISAGQERHSFGFAEGLQSFGPAAVFRTHRDEDFDYGFRIRGF
jgi:hypothetical protein